MQTASAQSDQGLRCPLTESLDTIQCINGEPELNFVHASGKFESVHFAHAQRNLFSWRSPYNVHPHVLL